MLPSDSRRLPKVFIRSSIQRQLGAYGNNDSVLTRRKGQLKPGGVDFGALSPGPPSSTSGLEEYPTGTCLSRAVDSAPLGSSSAPSPNPPKAMQLAPPRPSREPDCPGAGARTSGGRGGSGPSRCRGASECTWSCASRVPTGGLGRREGRLGAAADPSSTGPARSPGGPSTAPRQVTSIPRIRTCRMLLQATVRLSTVHFDGPEVALNSHSLRR